MTLTRNRFLLLLVASTLFIGCAKGDRPDLARVKGTVKVDGQPTPRLLVTFGPISGRPSTAVTNDKGEYTLEYMYQVPGAKVGQHVVSITTYFEDDASPEALKNKEKIPAKYNSKSELKEEVKPGQNVIDFDLKTS